MATPAPPQGALSDDALLSAPGPAATPAPQFSDDQLLAAKYSDDQLLAAPGPTAAPHSLASQALGTLAHGIAGGIEGIASTAQAAGRWADNHLGNNNDLLDRIDHRIDNAPVTSLLENQMDAGGVYRPTGSLGKIAQGAISGVTGAALTGGLGAVPAITGGAVGAAVPTAKAMGASDQTADDIGAGLSMLPIAGAGANALRAGAGKLATNIASRGAASAMSDQEAVHTVLLNDAMKQYQASGLPGTNTSFGAAAGYKKDLNSVLSQYSRSGQAAGQFDKNVAGDLGTATAQANSHNNTLANGPGSSLEQLQLPGTLPDAHAPAVQDALQQLNLASPQQFRNASAGPMTALASKIAPYAGIASAVGSLAHGNMGPVMDLAAGSAVGGLATKTLPMLGRAADHLFGTAVTPAEANLAAAQRAVQQRGLTVPQPVLPAMRAATGDNMQLAVDNAAASDAQDVADKQYLYQHADAQAMNRQFDMNANQQRAYQVSDAQAMDRQRTQQQNFERAQQVGDATAMDQQRTAQQNFERAQQVGDATAMDRQRTQQQNFDMAQQVGDATAMNRQFDASAAQATAQQAKGQNAADAAGNWLEKLRIGMAKKANPGVPITGPASLDARGSDQVFAATNGRYGSPVEPGAQDFTQQGPPPPAPSPAPVAPGPAPAAPPPAPAGPPGAPPRDATNPDAPLSGGLHLAAQMASDQLPGRMMPPPAQMHNSALAVLGETDGAAFNAGFNSDRTTAQRVANHAVSATQQQSQQATSEVSSLMGQPNGGDRGPIQNQARWQGAADNYQRHASQMMQIAPSQAHKIAISQIAAAPASTTKQAIRDVFAASNPTADMSVFTPTLMKGTN